MTSPTYNLYEIMVFPVPWNPACGLSPPPPLDAVLAPARAPTPNPATLCRQLQLWLWCGFLGSQARQHLPCQNGQYSIILTYKSQRYSLRLTNSTFISAQNFFFNLG